MFITKFRKLKKLLKSFGPGFITGASDDDVSGITTYSVVGATTGYSQLWLMVLSTPLLVVVQGMCAKIGDVLKIGLGKAIKVHFGFRVAFLASAILLLINTITIAADFAGMASVLNMLFPTIPLYVFLPFLVLFLWYLVVFRSYQLILKFFLIAASLLGVYILAGVFSQPNWSQVLQNTFLPEITPSVPYFAAAVALLGTTIAPYLFYWQTAEEVEEHRTVQQGREAFKLVLPGMLYTNLIAYFIILICGTALYKQGITDLESPYQIAQTLQPLAGDLAYLLFAVGVLGSGLLAIPILAASSAYALAETFNWREGLDQKIQKAKGFYAVLTITFLLGLLIIFSPLNPIKSLFYSQILAGILAPFLLILILLLSASPKIMGELRNGFWTNLVGIFTILIMILAVLAFFWSLLA